ncbi:DNA glycosylase [Pholiota conissans]|uniref:DNA-(apurinic or apyrimidinic site) lyase n=1 Tax=Pholiota conissans TaxID=109636 RepID=A0A9P6D5L8_9AGAR|nr:DNA glycosylase [Pholiota conissans]
MTLVGFKSFPLPLAQLALDAVLKCGQSFRWSTIAFPLSGDKELEDSSPSEQVEYRLCLRDRVVCLRQSFDTLYYRSIFPDPQPTSITLPIREAETLKWLKDYFQLDVDLISLYREWGMKDKVFAKFRDRFEGIRILRQDPWENLISFICSSNNNISRITKMVQNLCIHYSSPLISIKHPFLPSETLTYHPFPTPSVLSRSGVALHLRSLGFGYRAEFIQRTAKMLVDAHGIGCSDPSSPQEDPELWLQGLRGLSTADAREELLKFVGVGRKVADCILLMSLDKKEVIPVDTHVYQIAVKHYGMKGSYGGKTNMTPKLYEDINSRFLSIWGDYAGWAHSVLFTADLKFFSNYGSAISSTEKSPAATLHNKKNSPTSQSGSPVISPSARRKKRLHRQVDLVEPEFPTTPKSCKETTEHMNLVDRVKKRRRNV